MRKSIALLFLFVFSTLFSSCLFFLLIPHSDMTESDRLRGKQIVNYPDWIVGNKYSMYNNGSSFFVKDNNFPDLVESYFPYFGSSKWIECNETSAKSLLSLIPNAIIDSNYDGKFRVDVFGQYIILYFDKAIDNYHLAGKYFYNWYGNAKNINDIDVEIEQSDENIFSYNAYLKKSLYESTKDAKKVKVTFTKIDDETYNYKLDFENEEFFECEIMNPKNMFFSKWLVDFDFSKNQFPVSYSLKNQTNDDIFLFEFLSADTYLSSTGPNGKYLFSPSGYVNAKWFIDGISLKEFDSEQNKASFNIYDCNGERTDFADYFEIHVKSRDDVELTFYKLNSNNEPVVVKSYSAPELVWDWDWEY